MVAKTYFVNTDAALADASLFADRMLRANTSSGYTTRTVHHDHYHWGSPGWYYAPQPVYAGPSPSHSEKKDHSWIAIPAAIVALGTMYFIGQNHAEWSQARQGISNLKQKNRIVQTELSSAHPVVKSTVQAVFEKQMSILEKIRSSAATGLLLKTILVTSVILSGIGGLASGGYLFAASLEPLLAYGAVSSFLTAAAMLYRTGFSSMNNEVHAEAEELRMAVGRAAEILRQTV